MSARGRLAALEREIIECRCCPRLVEWREEVAREKRAAFRDWDYWGRPIAGFGDPAARVVLLGLAPAAHGANRTGRVFTGDRSGDFLFAALHATGFANQPWSRHRDDGLELTDCFITAAVRCAPPANRPLPAERDACREWLDRELALLPAARVIVCLGAYAWEVIAPRPRPRFGHGAEARAGRYVLLGSFHPSQQNTFTGKLTPSMLEAVLQRAKQLADDTPVVARDKTPDRRRDETPVERHDETPDRRRDETPVERHDETPDRRRDETPVERRGDTSNGRRDDMAAERAP